MKTTISILFAAAVALSSAPAHAAKFDLSTMNCKQFLESGDDNINGTQVTPDADGNFQVEFFLPVGQLVSIRSVIYGPDGSVLGSQDSTTMAWSRRAILAAPACVSW